MHGMILRTLGGIALLCGAAFAEPLSKPNVLFIAVDDLRDWVGYLGKNPQVKTPNIDKLAARGVSFTRSYCAAPVCNPARAALLSGMRPSTTGIYDNDDDWRKAIAPERMLNAHFRANGYKVLGAGKIHHEAYTRPQDWDGYLADEPEPRSVVPKGDAGVGSIKFAALDAADEDLEDWKIVDYAISQLGKSHDKPLFLACGIHKPHLPWNVPKKYFDMHPLAGIKLPPHLENGKDLADLPPSGKRMAVPEGDHRRLTEAGRWEEAVQGYLAAISYTDMLIGRLMEAFDKSPMKDNTIICFWGDHGWHLGEKEHWKKFALWEEATRIPLIWVAPGITKSNSVCHRTVDTLSVFPTLADLCGIPLPSHLEGKSIRSLLEDVTTQWDQPALTTYTFDSHAVRSEGWRYIRYRNGDEELYDEAADPNEWNNLADDPTMKTRKTELGRFMPISNANDLNGNPAEGKFKGSAAKQGKKNGRRGRQRGR